MGLKMVKLRYYNLSPQIWGEISLSATHKQNLSVLVTSPKWQDSLFYTFFMLPFTQSLDLALTFIMRVYENKLTQGERELFLQVRCWRANRSDLIRYELFEKAEALGFDNPISCLALSIFLSEGSMVPAGLEAVYPEPWQAPWTLANTLCLILHSYSHNPELQATYLDQFIQLAQEQFNCMPQDMDTGRNQYLYLDATMSEET